MLCVFSFMFFFLVVFSFALVVSHKNKKIKIEKSEKYKNGVCCVKVCFVKGLANSILTYVPNMIHICPNSF